MYVWREGLRKTWLDKCLKTQASQDLSTSNMVNGPKNCSNLHDINFIIINNYCERNCVGKSLS